MISKIRCSNEIGVVVLLLWSAAPSTAAPLPEVPVTRAPAIFVAEFQDVGAPECGAPRSAACTIPVRVRVTRILKDRDRLGLSPCEVEVNLVRWPLRDGEAPVTWWSGITPRRGARYLILSSGRGSLAEMIENPGSVNPISDQEDPVSDAELILRVAGQPLQGQADAIAGEISASAAIHGRILSEYAAALLDDASQSESSLLAGALVTSGGGAFSENGKEDLLFRVAAPNGLQGGVPENRLRVFVGLVARYFVLEGAKVPDTGLTRIQRVIVQSYFPRMLGSERERAAWRMEIRGAIAESFRVKCSALAGSAEVPAEFREKIGQFVASLGLR
jgi:hypothetical protein